MFTLRRQGDNNPLSYYGKGSGLSIYEPTTVFAISGINRGDIGDVEMYDLIDQIVDGLFSACVTFGSVPVIRCPKGNAAELVAEVSASVFFISTVLMRCF